MGEFRMPSLGADMEAATLVEWLVKPDALIKRGDIIAVVETQKGAIEIEAFENGILERVLVDVGARVPVSTPLALIETGATPGEAIPAAATKAPAEPPREGARANPPTPEPRQSGHGSPRATTRASPVARRLAGQHQLDLTALSGSGPAGAVVLADVEAALRTRGARSETPQRAGAPDLSHMRAAIASAMSRSKREIPHYYLAHTLDLTAAQTWLAKTNSERPPDTRLLMGALFVKAAAVAARSYPEFNGFFGDQQFRTSDAIHVGVAIAIRGGGLVAPAIHNTAELDLGTLMMRMRDLIQRVRAGRFRSSEIADPTLTVSSLGDRGVETLFGVIYPPQVAIVGFGKIVDRPWVAGGTVLPRPTVTVTLAADHRVSDGHRGALFLAEIEHLLQEPEAL
jgi:pyruvate dehydrogenase E2 component (dihydrolipoamide acetyltransferase)